MESSCGKVGVNYTFDLMLMQTVPNVQLYLDSCSVKNEMEMTPPLSCTIHSSDLHNSDLAIKHAFQPLSITASTVVMYLLLLMFKVEHEKETCNLF